ncbi:tigger transposable element-derived protein 6-like [Daktulosphaira vitifoliae]|uniref:tigger transposable element-derived protein 6-like n=1 Tax=Daktulosphaira vitifoliae TaxID=58002 RepID=UPI0021AA5194|nr:tigger transposable element-derived protein 6-like [Daktulosphaira vitifoliae]
MTGEKKNLLVVGKSKHPRCFKGVKSLPVDYSANKNAWMTQEIFSQWLIKWDNELSRKMFFLVDNCTAHNPCDQGIIRTLKAYYRSKIREWIITLLDETLECQSSWTLKANDLAKKINVLEALHLVNEAWNNISDVTIQNCFRHGGFIKTEEEEKEEENRSVETQEDLTAKTYVDWMNIDSDFQTSEEYSKDQICQFIANESTSINEEKNDEGDYDEEEVKPPSNNEVLEALKVLRKAVHHRVVNFNIQYEYENYISIMVFARVLPLTS